MSEYTRSFDECSPMWRRDLFYNLLFLRGIQDFANHRLQARGHIFLNEVYDDLGIERTSAGALVGWLNNGDGDNYVDFGLAGMTEDNVTASFILEFNVDGVIYDKIGSDWSQHRPIQTRSEETGLAFWPTFEDAKEAADEDPTIWKISWSGKSGKRVRFVRQEDGSWKDEPLMEAVNEMLGREMDG